MCVLFLFISAPSWPDLFTFIALLHCLSQHCSLQSWGWRSTEAERLRLYVSASCHLYPIYRANWAWLVASATVRHSAASTRRGARHSGLHPSSGRRKKKKDDAFLNWGRALQPRSSLCRCVCRRQSSKCTQKAKGSLEEKEELCAIKSYWYISRLGYTTHFLTLKSKYNAACSVYIILLMMIFHHL